MHYIADLHIHSPFSRATSPTGDLAGLAAWAGVKGIQVVGTGDFTHPGWFRSLREQLQPAEPGFFRLAAAKIPPVLAGTTPDAGASRFLLSAEISSIYKRHGRVRKVHNLVYVPDFASAERLNAKLAGIGNLESDGRPILGLDSRDLLEIVLEQAPDGFLVPAHIWTPWFSLFGSKSGFDTIEECFGDLSAQVFALETGLSSDPEMNRLISALDRFALISNSDCHSPAKLGREANLFDTGFDYFSLKQALQNPNRGGLAATIEFFPEEGKYHADGHRNCQVCLDPQESRRHHNLCPVCGKPLTIGVLHRVMELADREAPLFPPGAPAVHSLIPLPEVLGEIIGKGPASKGVIALYSRVIARFGSEFNLLLHASREEINDFSPVLAEAVSRIRDNRVIRKPGFDGEFGVIRVFAEGEAAKFAGQNELFAAAGRKKNVDAARPARLPLPVMHKPAGSAGPATTESRPDKDGVAVATANSEQEAAIRATEPRLLVIAGPGTGKTFTLVARLGHLLRERQTPAGRIAAITFTNRAAAEIRERLQRELGAASEQVLIGTFHHFCLHWLRRQEPQLAVVGPEERERLLKLLHPELSAGQRHRLSEAISRYAENLASGRPLAADPEIAAYLAALEAQKAVDMDLIVPRLVARLRRETAFCREVRQATRHLLVDEFQDVNQSQFELVQLLAESAELFAIGDPDQAIYGFRGSDLRFFRELAAQPATKVLALRDNYRSAPVILAAAGAVIGHNRQQAGVELRPHRDDPGIIEYYQAPTPAAEAEFLVQRLEELMGGVSSFSHYSGRGGEETAARSFGDFAILCRLSRQSEEIAHALARRGLPYQLVGSTPFFMLPPLRPLALMLRLATGALPTAEFLELLASRPGVGAQSLARLETALPLGSHTLAEIEPHLAGPTLSRPLRAALAYLKNTIHDFSRTATANGIGPALQNLAPDLGLALDLPESKRFLDLAHAFGRDLAAFSRHLSEQAKSTIYDERPGRVALMTIHAAKGLEFPVVFIPGLEEGVLPAIPRTPQAEAELEEERRLFYVAMTRAREILLLSGASRRSLPGSTPAGRQPSRFLGEIPPRLLHQIKPRSRPRQAAATQLKLF